MRPTRHLLASLDGVRLPVLAFALIASASSPSTLLALPAVADPSDRAEPQSVTIDDEIVVSASLVDVEKKRIGSSVTVIDRDEIERRNKTTVLELLRTVPGLEVGQTGGPGRAASVFIRGGNSSHTLVTLDGARLNGNTTGAFDFSDLAADQIERIEIVRGPQGLLYGSEAVAGAVHIVTRRGAGEPSAWLEGSVGSDNYSKLAGGVRGGDESFHYNVGAARLATDGVSAADEDAGNSEADAWTNLTASARVGGRLWGEATIDAAVRYTAGDADVDGFTFPIGPTDDLNAEQERRMVTSQVEVRAPLGEGWTQTLTVSDHRDDLEGIDPDDVFSNFEIRSTTTALATQADLAFSSDDRLSIGYRVEKRQADNVGSFEQSLYVRSLYLESLWSLGPWVDLSVGVRNDAHDVFGDETTYRAALSARLGELWRLHGSFGTGFKAPTFNELYFPFYGNLGLKPELSEGYDVGVELSRGAVTVDLTYFDTSFEDLILFAFPGGFVNVAEASSTGFELSLDWRASEAVRVYATHTHNETEDLSTGAPLARRPERRSTVGLSMDWAERWSLAADVIAVADRIDVTGEAMDDYERVDLALRYRLSERVRPFARLENLLDADYSEVPGYTTPGATVVVGAHIGF